MPRGWILRCGLGGAGILIALAVWQLAASAGPLAGGVLPTATSAIGEATRLLGAGETWSAIGQTVLMALAGLALSALIGIALGVAIGVSPLARAATRVPLEFLKPIPPIVILPIVVLVLGPTATMGFVLVLFGCAITIAVQTAAGVADADPVARATARSYGLGRAETLARVILPSALPYIGTALRTAAPTALIVAVVAGLLGGGPGLGHSILISQLSGDRVQLFAYVLILGALGLLVQGLAQWAEQRALHWHPQYRKERA